MRRIICHGLGEGPREWEAVGRELSAPAEIPDLFGMVKADSLTYDVLYAAFEKFCGSGDAPIALCGLSLGGILVLDYASRHPDNVESLILIGTPYKIPKVLFALQNGIFCVLPQRAFSDMGLTKKSTIALMGSVSRQNIPHMAFLVRCKTLVLCGEKDKANRQSAISLHHAIAHSDFSVIPNAGHQVNVDAPKALTDRIEHFWQ